jgi:iron complex transport system substrate-binding protein
MRKAYLSIRLWRSAEMKISTFFVLVFLASSAPLVCMPADASDFTLGIFGNANMDDTIDDNDIKYVEGIIEGTNEETELADANYDGQVDMNDIIQIELIISGEEKKITVLDSAERIVTVKKPIETIVVSGSRTPEAIRAIGARDRIVGVDEYALKRVKFYPEISKKESIGGWPPDTDIEKILELNPDVLISYGAFGSHAEWLGDKLNGTGIPVVGLDLFNPATLENEMNVLGYILGERKNADEYLRWRNKYITDITDGISGISDDEKPRVFIDLFGQTSGNSRTTYGKGGGMYELSVMAGGSNIASDLPGMYPKVETEWILEQNPDVVVGVESTGGYETDGGTVFEEYFNNLVGLPGFEMVSAVETNRVYIIDLYVTGGLEDIIGLSYLATWFYPDIFRDLDPQEIHQEYVDEFCGIDFDVVEHGLFVYPPLEEC